MKEQSDQGLHCLPFHLHHLDEEAVWSGSTLFVIPFASFEWWSSQGLHCHSICFVWMKEQSDQSLHCLPFCLHEGAHRLDKVAVWSALQHILDNFGCVQLTYTHCSWASLLGSLPVLSSHSFASNWQLLFMNQRKRENGLRKCFHDHISTKECAGRGDRTRGHLHAKRTRIQSSYRARLKTNRNSSGWKVTCLKYVWMIIPDNVRQYATSFCQCIEIPSNYQKTLS